MMDSLAGFQLDGDLPDNIFEDDEIEIAVVKPILNDIIKDIIKDNEDTGGNNHQSNYQTINLSVLQQFDVVTEETETKRDNDYIKSLISGCVDLALNQSKLSDFHWLHSTTTSTNFSEIKSCRDAKQQNMGTIELCDDSDSDEDIIVIRDENPSSSSTGNGSNNKCLLPVAKVQPYEPPLNSEEEEQDDDVIDLDRIMLDNNDQNDLISGITESDPFMGIEPDSSNIVEGDDNKQDLPSHPAPPVAANGSGFGLRLRSFAVDPTNNSFNNAESNSNSNDSSTNASWHVTDEACPPDPIIPQNNSEVSIYEVPSSSNRPVPTVTYHHLPTTSVQASIATVPQPIRQPIILRRALNQSQQQQRQLQVFQSPSGQLFGVAPANQQQQQRQTTTRFVPGQQITIRFPNNQQLTSTPSNVQSYGYVTREQCYQRGEPQRAFSSPNVQVQQQQPASAVTSNIRTFTAPANAAPANAQPPSYSLVMKENHKISIEYLWQEEKISYHTDLGKTAYYHCLTAVQQTHIQKGLFKIFIPSTSYKKVIPNPKCLTKLTAEVTIHPGTDAEGSAIDQAYIKFDQLAITIQAYYPKTAEEVRRNVYNQNMFLLKPSEALEFYRTFTPQKFMYFAVYVPKTSLLAVNVSHSAKPYAQELFDFLKGKENSVVSKQHRTVTVMRLNMIFTLLKGAFPQLNASVFEDSIFKRSNYVKTYKSILLKLIESNMQKFKSQGGFLPYSITHGILVENPNSNNNQQAGVVGNNVVSKKFCVVCRFEDTEEKVLEHQAKFHFIDSLAKRFNEPPTNSCPIQKGCKFPEVHIDRLTHLGVHHKQCHVISERLIKDLKRLFNCSPMDTKLKCPEGCYKQPYTNNTKNYYYGAWELMTHYLSHVKVPLKKLIEDLQVYQGLPEFKCPIQYCPLEFKDTMLEHVAFAHLGVLEYLLNRLRNKENAKDQAMQNTRRFLINFTKIITDGGHYCKGCDSYYGNISSLNLHIAKQHDAISLMDKFNDTCKEYGEGTDKLKLCICGKTFKTSYAGALHLGISKCIPGFMSQTNQSVPSPSTSRLEMPIVSKPDHRNIEKVPIARVEPSTSKSITVNNSNYYGFKCSICNFNSGDGIGNKFDQRSALVSLAQHIVNFHDNEKFDHVLRQLKNENTNAFSCPSEGCNMVYYNKLSLLRQHVLKSHPEYIKEFLKKYRKSLNLSSCLIIATADKSTNLLRTQLQKTSTARASEEDDIVILDDEEPKQLQPESRTMKSYKEYCSRSNIEPFSCNAMKVKIFIDRAYTEMKLSAEVIKKFVSELEEKHNDRRLSTHPLIVHALSLLSDVATRPIGGGAKNKVSSNKEKMFICWTCELEFKSVSDLIQHLNQIEHGIISIGCKYCNSFHNTMRDIESAHRFLVFHTFSKVHLFNRWRIMYDVVNEPPRHITDLEKVETKCEVCAEVVVDLEPHAKSKKHEHNASVINMFTWFCDYKKICPVTCSERDILFFLNTYASKTLMPDESRKSVTFNLFQLIQVLSKIHDPLYDGQDVAGSDNINRRLGELMAAGFQDSPKFICFQCSFLAKDLKELTTHVQTSSKQHADVMLRCESCSMLFRSFWKLELHCYTREHVMNFCDKYAGCAKPAEPCKYSETYCPFCRKNVDSSSHLVKEDHIGPKMVLDSYFKFCQENNKHPINDASNALVKEFKENWLFKSVRNNMPEASIRAAFETLKLHHYNDGRKTEVDDPDYGLNVPKSSNADQSPTPQESKKIAFEGYGLSVELEEKCSTCPVCFIDCNCATYLLYHLLHIHGKRPISFIYEMLKEDTKNIGNALEDSEVQRVNCGRCFAKCSSPLIMALHHDRHQMKNKLLTCPHCKKSYTSPASYFSNDTCKRNSIPDRVKKEVDKAIMIAVQRSPYSAVLGCPDILSKHYKQDQPKARDEITEVFSKISKKRSRSSSDADNDSPVRKERKVKPIYKLSSDESADDDDDYVLDEIPNLSSSSDESRSSSRLSSVDHPETENNQKNYKLKPCQITITAEDRAKAEKALDLQELLKQMKSCSVVIRRIKDSKVIPQRRSISSESSYLDIPDIPDIPDFQNPESPRTDSKNSQVLLPPAFKPKKPEAEIKAEKYFDLDRDISENNELENDVIEKEKEKTSIVVKKEKFKCEICDKICINEKAKEQHMKFTHTNKTPAPPQKQEEKNDKPISGSDIQNPKNDNDDDEYPGLVERENGKGVFCNLCQKSFAKLRAGKTHYTKYHRNSQQNFVNSNSKYTCTLCSTTISSKQNAERHVRNVHKILNTEDISNSIQPVSENRSRHVSAASSVNSGISEASSIGQKRRRTDSVESTLTAGTSSKKLRIAEENSTESKPLKVQNTQPIAAKKPGPKSQKTASDFAKRKITEENDDISDKNPGDNNSILTPNLPKPNKQSSKSNYDTDKYDDDEYFCLDCENSSHPRRYIQNKSAHIQEYSSHRRFQKCSDFMKKVRVKLPDSAYDTKDGPKIRKLYKKYAEMNKETSPVNLFEYESGEKVCKIPKCTYRNSSIVYMFRHIREDHFQDH